MKKILTFFQIVLSLLFAISNVYADFDPYANASFHPTVIPPAPTVSELGRYDNIPVNLSTGAASVNIPLYTLISKNINLPISLTYSSNGVKIDKVASWVSMDWSLKNKCKI